VYSASTAYSSSLFVVPLPLSLGRMSFHPFLLPVSTVAHFESLCSIRWQLAASSFAACRIVLHMHREATTSPSGAHQRMSTYTGGSSAHGQGRDRILVESEDFALTTFSPGVEFEYNEPSDGRKGEA
jgi:hypothetical protein